MEQERGSSTVRRRGEGQIIEKKIQKRGMARKIQKLMKNDRQRP